MLLSDHVDNIAGASMSIQTPPTPSSKSRWIWPFELLEQIGEGGMGVVYRARYVVNGRHVALKMLPGDVKDETSLARFEREVEILKSLKHPNIVRSFGGVCEDKRRFYAMELVEGGTLEDKLREKGKLAWEQVVYYGLQMCAALECSHQAGIVHRDVKPSNFLVTPNGQLKLGDFGLASVIASRRITAAGKTAGTFLYMAPEQIRGLAVTPKTDLYALGCVLYELLTGRAPFVGQTPAATLHLHCHTDPPRPTETVLDCPVSLERLILQLMEKDPELRPASAAAVARELKAVSLTISVVSPQADRTDRPLGYVDPARREPKTAPLIPALTSTTRQTSLLSIVLAVLLMLSLAGNVTQRSRHDESWQQSWIQAASSPHREVRLAAAEILGKMAPRSPASVSALTQGLTDADMQVRTQCILGLQTAGGAARSAIPALVKVRNNDPQPTVRDAAEVALTSIRLAPAQRSRMGWMILATVLLGGVGLIGFFVRARLARPASA